MIYKGSCHCGQVAFEAEGNLEKIMECNCSICSKRGSLHWFIPLDSFRLMTPEDSMGTYTFNKHAIKHRYGPKCGCAPYSEGIAPSGNYLGTSRADRKRQHRSGYKYICLRCRKMEPGLNENQSI